ncbi:hypothetical protein [Mucilaginibacter rubeus]|uniref:Addiction module protein n=1 Tax=Mucilaginibacter rubeus TaxID=2027860 RepID=A0A5C1I3U1_9SPHI|nr:hypothetical protein [Mucilaginibacter rubeus]QEM11811.1 hypothetical protein DEO27_017845 [Mucilaginibacter rubeus]
MLTVQVKLSVEDIINSLSNLEAKEIDKLQKAIAEFKNDIALQQSIERGLEDVKNGRITPSDAVMNDIKARYNYNG